MDATKVALESAGSAQTEFQKSLDSIKKKAEATKGAFQELVWGDGGLNSFIKSLLDGTTGILKFANDTKLLNVLLVDLGIILTVTLIPKLISFGSLLLTNIGYIALTTAETGSLALGLKAVGTSATVSKLALGGFLAILTLGAMAWSAYNSAQEEARQGAIDTLDAYESQNESIQASIKNVEDENATKESLISTISTLNSSYDAESGKLEDINQLRQDAIDLLYEEAKAKAQQTVRETGSEYDKAKEYMGSNVSLVSGLITGTPEEAYKQAGKLLDDYNKQIQDGVEIDQHRAGAMAGLENEYKALGKEIETNGAIVEKYNSAVEVSNMTLDEYIQSSKDAQSETSNFVDTEEDVISTTEEQSDAIQNLSDATSNTVSSLSSLNDALLEQEENGSISLDTALGLIENGYALALTFDKQTGAITINRDAMIELAKAHIQAQIAELRLAQTDIVTKLRNDAIQALKTSESFLAMGSALGGVMAMANGNADYQSISAQIKVLESSLSSIGDIGTETYNGISDSSSKAKDKTDELTDALKEQKEALESERDNYETVIDTILDKFDEEIDKIKELKDAKLDEVDSSIDALKKQRDTEEKVWDARIDALKAQNEAINKQIELQKLQEALAKAQATNVMVLDTTGKWGVRQDESAVSSAVADINDFNLAQKQQSEVDLLEQQKNATLASLDAQIQAWEDYKSQQESIFDAQIANQELMKASFEDMTNGYEENQNNLLVQQLAGIDLEQANWQTRLTNIAGFVNSYNSILAKLGDVNAQISASESTVKSSSSSTGTSSAKKSTGTTAKKSSTYVSTLDRTAGVSKAYASGVASIGQNEIALVGDSPNAELVLGSKANGSLMNLGSGSGVANANSTKTFAGLINTLGKSGMLSGLTGGSVNNNTSSNATNISIGNITLPSVTNARSFVDELNSMSFSRNMLQQAYSTT